MLDLKEQSIADIANILKKSPQPKQINGSCKIEFSEPLPTQYLELSISQMSHGEKRFFFMIIDDVSHSKQNESLEKVTENYKKALGSTVHELRTPLNGVISMLDMLEFEISKELNDKYLRTASTSAKLLLNLVNDILDFS